MKKPSTKAFTTQITVLYLMALKIGKAKGIISDNHKLEFLWTIIPRSLPS